MSLDNYFKLKRHANDPGLIKPLKKIDNCFSESENHEDGKQSKSFSETFQEVLEEEDFTDDTAT